MISVQEARRLADKSFPQGPEAIITRLGIEIREVPLDGCDGWCLTSGERSIIRINSQLSANRRRFTLAHELAHLLLGIPSVVGESYEDMLGSDDHEERRVNDLASELLLPSRIVTQSLPSPPVVATALSRLAKKANISELATAIRVCNLTQEIGLVNGSVVLFDGCHVRWQWSKTLSLSNAEAVSLLEATRAETSGAFRQLQTSRDVIVSSLIENPRFGTATLFVQILPPELGLRTSPDERRVQLEQSLFAGDVALRSKVSGLMGAHKTRAEGLSSEQAVELFWKRNYPKLVDTSLNSDIGREYVQLRINEWITR